MQHEPWLKLKDDSGSRVGNDRFEGFVMDLLDNLQNKTGARFEVEDQEERIVQINILLCEVNLQRDGRYGALDVTAGQWSGGTLSLYRCIIVYSCIIVSLYYCIVV